MRAYSLCLFKLLTAVFTLFAGASSAVAAGQQSQCPTVIGWKHLSRESRQAFVDAVDQIARLVKEQKCSNIREIILSGLDSDPEALKESQRVYSSLLALDSKQEIQVIGFELSKEELKIENFSTLYADSILSKVEAKCAGQLPQAEFSQQLKDFRLIYPGPRFEFAKNQQRPVSFDAFEDQKLKEKSYEALRSKNENSNFDLTQISEETHADFKSIFEQNKQITDGLIDRMIGSAKNAGEKENLRKLLNSIKQLQESAIARNTFIANHVANHAAKNHYVVLIGEAHLDDLVPKIHSACR